MGEIYYRDGPPKRQERPLFYGRHFAWIARCCVKVARELKLSDQQFLKMVELLVKELELTNPRFNKPLFETQIRTAAAAAKEEANAQVFDH